MIPYLGTNVLNYFLGLSSLRKCFCSLGKCWWSLGKGFFPRQTPWDVFFKEMLMSPSKVVVFPKANKLN